MVSLVFCPLIFANGVYQINLIVFKNTGTSGLNSEIWANNPSQPNFGQAINFLPASGADPTKDSTNLAQVTQSAATDNTQYRLLPMSQFGLNNALQRLNNSGNYKVLTAIAWQQPLATTGQLLHVFAGPAYAADGSVIANPADAAVANWELNGTVNIKKLQFIEFTADFLLTERVPVLNTDNSNSTTEDKLMSFPLRETVRTRGNEIQYLDNPMYGSLVLITPIK